MELESKVCKELAKEGIDRALGDLGEKTLNKDLPQGELERPPVVVARTRVGSERAAVDVD